MKIYIHRSDDLKAALCEALRADADIFAVNAGISPTPAETNEINGIKMTVLYRDYETLLGERYYSVFISCGGKCRTSRMVHTPLFGAVSPDVRGSSAEPAVFAAGNIHIGTLAGYDFYYPEMHRLLALKGADIIISMAADICMDNDLLSANTRVSAASNGCYSIYAGEFGLTYAAFPDGTVLAGSETDNGIIYAADMAVLRNVRNIRPWLGTRRPDMLLPLVKNINV